MRTVPQDTLAGEIQARTGGAWIAWFGHVTGSYFAMSPCPPYPWQGLVWDVTPQGLEARIAVVEARFGPGRRP